MNQGIASKSKTVEPPPGPKTITMTPRQFREAAVVDHDLLQRVETSIKRSQDWLLAQQKPEGYWIGELFVDVTLISDYIIFMHWRGEVDFAKQAKIVKSILDRRLPDGGWNIYVGGPAELNATVKAYFALKLAGYPSDEPVMKKAHATILRLGGIPRTNTYNKLMLALFGQYPWKYLPIIPSEIVLLPNWLYFNIYEMSSWSRCMVVPLSIINHFKPTRYLPPEKQLHELFPYGTEHSRFRMPWTPQWLSWPNFFLAWDSILKTLDSLPWKPFRARALRFSEQWMTERVKEGSDGLGAIFPSMMYSIIALKALGYSDDHPIVQRALRVFNELIVDDEASGDLRMQPCFSPIWDTAITTFALGESGIPPETPQMVKAAEWMISKEVRIRGDWHVKNPHPENSGWAFEFNNPYYADVDDTFKVLLALSKVRMPDEAAKKEVTERAMRWAISFQCRNGGWAAFDKNVTKSWLEDVPFADHNAILDPPCSDITSRALEVFGRYGFSRQEPFVRRALKFVRLTQNEDGPWIGRWGVNYIYGTWLVLRGLAAIGEDMNQDWILRARDWLESCQNPDGGWGETCASYDDPRLKGQGDSTVSQTAWALMGVIACGDVRRPSIIRGIDYLSKTQQPDGQWREDLITGTGFPRVFYLKYDMYRNNWPLLALSDYRRAAARSR
jgi:squalene-hopene/tetraprenyl-beta-curcumene cyclase